MASKLSVGGRVKHSLYGEGECVSINSESFEIKFDNNNRTTRFPLSRMNDFQPISRRSSKSSSTSFEIPRFSSVFDFCQYSKQSINSEINAAKFRNNRRFQLYEGKKISESETGYVYSFETDTDLHFPDGTPVFIWRNNQSCPGTVVICDEDLIIIKTETNLDGDSSVEISAETWKILEKLNERLDEIVARDSGLVSTLVCNGRTVTNTNKPLRTGQKQGIRDALSQNISFIWGPPGTGKTETLAKIAFEFIKRDCKVLMVSQSNVSVDGAILRLCKIAKDCEEELPSGVAVRYGYPRSMEIWRDSLLSAFNLALENNPRLRRERETLLKERQKVARSSKRYEEIAKRLTQIRNSLHEEESRIVLEASFVATTVAKATMDSTIYSKADFDVVIFDEASMAYVPQVVFASSLAKEKFVCIGDFRQLPPITQDDKNDFLQLDVFQYCGIVEAVENNCGHPWLCLLDTQYRMHGEIADFVGREMYAKKLKTPDSIRKERNKLAVKQPFPESAFGLIDLSGALSVCIRASESRLNILSAFVSLATALKSLENNGDSTVGIIAPYNVQARFIRSAIRDLTADDENSLLKHIKCSTVHQFQGSEENVIVYDATDCYRQPFPGKMFTSQKNRYADRLFNVAATRARGKLIVVSNVDYLRKKNVSSRFLFGKALDLIESSQTSTASYLDFNNIIARNDVASLKFYQSAEEANEKFFEDLESAKERIFIDIPDPMQNDDCFIKRLAGLLAKLARKVNVAVRCERKERLPLILQKYAEENFAAIQPVSVVDNCVWFGEPPTKALFISNDKIVPVKYRALIRFVGARVARSTIEFLGMKSKKNEQQETRNVANSLIREGEEPGFGLFIQKTKRCPECGSPMILRSKRGFFLGCSNYPQCRHTEKIDVETVSSYLKEKHGLCCPWDGRPLQVLDGRYGVYIECAGPQRHKPKFNEI